MRNTITYNKPDLIVLGTAVETIRGTHIKGSRGVVEAIQWRIQPTYDLDE